MSSYDIKRFAEEFVSLQKRHDALARSTQLGFSSVLNKVGESVDLTQAVTDSSDAIEQVEAVNDLTKGISETVGDTILNLTEVPKYLATFDESWDDVNEVLDYAFEQQEEIQETLEAARERLDKVAEELSDRLDLTEESVLEAQDNLELAGERLDALKAIADELANKEPLSTSELLALIATIDTAFIDSAMIKELDVGKLTVTETSMFDEAVVQKLFAEVVQAKVLEITEELIGENGTFTGRLTADHINVNTLSGTTINGLRINGGSFVQYASTAPAQIYPVQGVAPVVGDWKGGTTNGYNTTDFTYLPDGSIQIKSTPSKGSVSALWLNEGRVINPVLKGPKPGGGSTRYVRATISTSTDLEFLHVLSNVVHMSENDSKEDATEDDEEVLAQGGFIDAAPKPGKRKFEVEFTIPQGAKLEWVHIGADAVDKEQTFTINIERFAVLESRELGTHMRIDRLNGTPGLYGYVSPKNRTVAVTPTAITTYSDGGTLDNRSVRIAGDEIRFTQGGKLLGANTAKTFTELSSWSAPEGTWAWVLEEKDFFVRVGNAWLRDPSRYYNKNDVYRVVTAGRGTAVTLPTHLTDGSRALYTTVVLPKEVAPGLQPEVSKMVAIGRGARSDYWTFGNTNQDIKQYVTDAVVRGTNVLELRSYNSSKWFNENNSVVSLGVVEMDITFK